MSGSEVRPEACSPHHDMHWPSTTKPGTCGWCGRPCTPWGEAITADGTAPERERVYSVRILHSAHASMTSDAQQPQRLGPYFHPASALREAHKAVRKGATVVGYDVAEVAWREVPEADLRVRGGGTP